MNEVADLYDTETVTWGREGKERSLTVRGLSTRDLTTAIRSHGDSLNKLFQAAEGKLDAGDDLTTFGMELMDQFPDLVATLVALAADQPDRSGQILQLPAPTQLRLMEAIYTLTVVETGGLNDFLSRVFNVVRSVRQQQGALKALAMNTGT